MKTKLILGDCIDKLKELESNSVDSIVTDPPYGLEFMGKAWDSFKTGRISKYKEGGSIDLEQIESRKGKGGAGPSYTKRAAKRCRTCGKQEWSGSPCKCETPDFEIDNSTQHTFQSFSEAWATECYRVLKPGGHLLAFGGSRMYHRLAVGIEDAGFEIRDQIMWIYGSGFPKSHNIGKAVDKIEGNEREVVGIDEDFIRRNPNNTGCNTLHNIDKDGIVQNKNENAGVISKGNSQWEGWGTALKPAHEPIVLARKPLVGTVANNVLEWGVGGINIDGCRVPSAENDKYDIRTYDTYQKTFSSYAETNEEQTFSVNEKNELGRFPANIIFDEEAGKILDEQSGITAGGHWPHTKTTGFGEFGGGNNEYFGVGPKDKEKGGASRFFYCPKASKKDRDEGLAVQAKVIKGRDEGQDKMAVAYKARPTERQNIHPTVKPTELMKYLIRLVTPKGGIVLDPFMGSGSTGKAAVLEGMEFIGIEREPEYYEIAEQRINHVNKPKTYEKFFE